MQELHTTPDKLRSLLRALGWTLAASLALAVFVWLFRGGPTKTDEGGPIVLRITSMDGSWPRFPAKGDPIEVRKPFEIFKHRWAGKIAFNSDLGLRIAGPGAESQSLMQMAARSAGQILYVNFRILDQYVRQGFLLPLDDRVMALYRDQYKAQTGNEARPGLRFGDADFDPMVLNIPPAIWNVIYYPDPATGQRHVYCLPWNMYTQVLMYRKDLLAQAGFAQPPRTWEELYEVAYAITDPENGVHGLAKIDHPYNVIQFFYQSGAEIVRRKDPAHPELDQWEAVYDSEAGVEALRFIRRLLATKKTVNGKSSKLWDPAQAWAVNNKIAMMWGDLGSVTAFGGVDDPLVAFAPMPAGPHSRASLCNAAMYGINATVPKAEADAAWEFVKYWASDERMRIETEIYVKQGRAKFVNPLLLERFGFGEYFEEIHKSWLAIRTQAFAESQPEPVGKNLRSIYEKLRSPIEMATIVDHDVQAKLRDDQRYRELKALDPKPGSTEFAEWQQMQKAHEDDSKGLQQILAASTQEINQRLLANFDFKKSRTQYWIAYGLFAAVVVLFAIFGKKLWRLMTEMSARETALVEQRTGSRRRHLYAWAFMSLALLSILVWQYYPLLVGSLMAFQDYRVLDGSPLTNTRYVGLNNFLEVVNQPTFWSSLWITVKFVALNLLFGFWAPVVLAILLDEIPRGKIFFRIVYYLPAVLSGLVVAFLWMRLYEPTEAGLINAVWIHMAGWFGVEVQPIGWLTNPNMALVACILPSVWAGAGPGCLIYLAALKSIPDEQYEAADLDGAGFLHKIRHVTMPGLKALLIINFVGAFVGSFHSMGNIFVMTGGGPVDATRVLPLEVWLSAFVELRFGYATAVGWILGSMLIGFTVLQLRVFRNARFTTAPSA